MKKDTLPLLLFAKAPIAGRVKTRLQSHCSAEKAAEIAQVLLEESIIQATLHWPGQVYLSVALDAEHAFLQKMVAQYSLKLIMQCDGDLGEKMQGGFSDFGYPAAIMGCDAPHILADDLVRAHDLLLSGQAVLGPSEDGGYYFIGLPQAEAALFKGINWGTSGVLESTLIQANKNSVKFIMLEPLNDVDEWDDLLAAAKILPRLAALL